METSEYENECMKSFKENFEYVETSECEGYIKCKKTGKLFTFKTPIGFKSAFHRVGIYALKELKMSISWYVVRDMLD